jgi:hypothetical protein
MTSLALGLLLAASQAQAPTASLSMRSGASLFLAPSRTQGGFGGGVGVQLELDRHWLVHLDAAVLWGLGTAGVLRLGGAWQRDGLWRPVLRVDLELGVGQRLDFTDGGRLPPPGPSLGLGVSGGVLRFEVAHAVVSALEIGVGLGTDFLTAGPRVGLTLLEISVPLN